MTLRHALAAAVRRPPLLVALDFDGTLAPLRDDPATSRIIPAAREAIDRLARAAAAGAPLVLALVSGRILAELAELAAPPSGTYLAGSHGAETGLITPEGLQVTTEPPDPSIAERRDAWLAWAAEFVAAHPGTRLEPKPDGLAVHTRTVADAASRPALLRLVAAWGELQGAHVRLGNNVAELTHTSITKGDAIIRLRTLVGCNTVLYAGDDLTDEDAFAALTPPDVSIKVGPGDTRALFRVADENDLAHTLATLAELEEAPGQ